MKREAGRGTGRKSGLTDLAAQQGRGDSRNAQQRTQEDPRIGEGGQSARVPSGARGESYSGDEPQNTLLPSRPHNHDPAIETPGQDVVEVLPEMSHYKGLSLKNVGRDGRGRVIPHKRSEIVAKQVAIWVAGGADVNAIAIRMNIRPGLIKECYAKELAVGTEEIHMDVHEHILNRTKKSDRMAVFYAKAKMGWRDGDAKPVDTGVLSIIIHSD